jgi:CheY-like chemotaxis protein
VGYKILLADDSVTVQKIITLTFSDEGVDVLAVNNGDEAFHRLQYLRPALVMADVSIPGKNGYEICEFVKSHPEMKDTPVILLVPAFEPFDEERARRIGANQHLTKPFQSIRTLISTVKGLLESNPPKISTPLTNSGPLANTGALTQRVEQVAAQVTSETTGKVEAPSTFRSYPVKDTQPFPPDEEEAAAPSSAEAVVEDVLGIEVEASQSEVAPVKSGPLELEVEEVQAEAEPVVAPIPDQIETPALEPEPEPLAEEPLSVEQIIPEEEVVVPVINTQQELSGDLDHVLDLDDVLPEVWPQTIMVPQVEAPHPAIAKSTNDFHPAPSAIPQAVIDEIVNRVVAQLSEKLSGNLAGNLAGSLAEKLASQLAPEVAELVKHQTQPEPADRPSSVPLNQDSDSLLDLD